MADWTGQPAHVLARHLEILRAAGWVEQSATAARGSGACAADRGLRKLSSAVLRQQVDVAGVDTGRLNAALNPQAHRIVYGSNPGADAVRELRTISEVDRADLVMLAERGIIDAAVAARLPREIQRLRGEEYAPLLEAVDALADSLLDQVLAYQDVVMPGIHSRPARGADHLRTLPGRRDRLHPARLRGAALSEH